MKLELQPTRRPTRIKLRLDDGPWYVTSLTLATKIEALARFHEACGGEEIKLLGNEELSEQAKRKRHQTASKLK